MNLLVFGIPFFVGCGLSDFSASLPGETGLALTYETYDTVAGTETTETTATTETTETTETTTTPPASSPVVTDFYVAEDGYDIVLFFAASDVDGDLSGGTLEASINGVPESFSVPSDLDNFNPGGLSWVTIDAFDDCTRGGTTNVSGRVSDASGNMSSNNTANFTTSGYGVTVSETGNTTASTTNLGAIPDSPFFICGDIYATAVNYMADVDYINFRPPESGVFNFSLTWTAPSGDYDLYLLNSAGSVVLASSFEIGNVQPELFNYTLSSASQYQLAVGGWSGGTGPWVIEVQ